MKVYPWMGLILALLLHFTSAQDASTTEQPSNDNGTLVPGEIEEPNTKLGDFPWVLQLLRQVEDNNVAYCGATLITPSVAITAAYCVQNLGSLNRTQELYVRAGEFDTNRTDDGAHQDRGVVYIARHPEFSFGGEVRKKKHDIALLMLNKPFDINDRVQPIALPKGENFTEVECVVAGWGPDLRDSTIRTAMKKVTMRVWPVIKCRRVPIYRKNRFSFPKGTMCVGGEESRDACKGDGGGGLTCVVDDTPKLVGIVSWAFSCGKDKEPGVYTEVQYYMPWIRQQIEKMKVEYMYTGLTLQ